MGLYGSYEIRIKLGDKIVVVFLFAWSRELVPGEVINEPGMFQVDVGKCKGNGALGFGEEGYEEIRAKGDGSSNGSLIALR